MIINKNEFLTLIHFPGNESNATDLRCAALNNLLGSDNQMLTKPHFNHLEPADKYHQLNYSAHLKNIDLTSVDTGTNLEYVRNLKENNKFFIDSNSVAYGNANREYCNLNDCVNNGVTDKESNESGHLYDENVNEFDDSLSNNGDSSKELIDNSSTKRQRFDDINDMNGMLKYKNNGDGTKGSSFDYMKSFEGIRARSFDDIQNDEHQRLLPGSGEYRLNATSDELNRNCDENGASANYASSDDLNQTNSSDHGDKVLSGSEDESNG